MVIGLMAAAHAARADVSLPSDTRQRVALDGPWEILQSDSDDLKTLPEEGQWAPVTVPDRRWRGDSNEQPWPKSLWYRRTFDAPELDGRRAMLHFVRAGFQCRVYLNGKEVGNHIGAQTPFQFDVTDTIKAGQANELVVGCKRPFRAQRGEYDNMPKQWSDPRPEWADALPEGWQRKQVLEAEDGTVPWPDALMGYWHGGIYQPVSLILTPDAHVDDIFVIPSVRQKRLTVQVEIVSHFKAATNVRLTADVLDGDKTVKALPAAQLEVQSGRRVTKATLADDWADPKLWDPEHPNLYRCRVKLEAGELRDEASDRFGFREIWREGETVYLNGIPLTLRSETHYAGVNYPWPEGYRPYITKHLRDWRINAMLIKSQSPADPGFWDFCDEEGMLLIHQIDIGKPYGPPSYWDCGKAFAVELIRSIRNHPALIVQQLGNENTYGLGGGVPHAVTPWTDMLVDIYHAAKTADPTRLRTPGGGDTDQGGVSDFMDYHGGPTPAWNELIPNLHMVTPQLIRGRGDKPAMLSEWNETITVTMCGVIGDVFFRPIPTDIGLIAPRAAYRLTRQAQANSYLLGATEFRKQRVSASTGLSSITFPRGTTTWLRSRSLRNFWSWPRGGWPRSSLYPTITPVTSAPISRLR